MICCVISRSADCFRAAALKSNCEPFRKSVSRISRSISLSLTMCLPAMAAMRSRTTAPEAESERARMEIHARMLERLSNRKEELKMADVLLRALAIAGQLRLRNIGIAIEYLSGRA